MGNGRIGGGGAPTPGPTTSTSQSDSLWDKAVDKAKDVGVNVAHGVVDQMTDERVGQLEKKYQSDDPRLKQAKDRALADEVSAHRALARASGRGPGVRAADGLATANRLAKLPPATQLADVAKLRQAKPKEHQALLAAQKAGWIDDSGVQLATSIDTMGTSKWASSKEGKAVNAHVRSQFEKGELKYASDKGADLPGGWAFTTSSGKVTLADELKTSPEAGAALLAHEGLHSKRTVDGDKRNELVEETDAHLVQDAVWQDVGSSDSGVPPALGEDMSGLRARIGGKQGARARATAYVAGVYASGRVNASQGQGQSALDEQTHRQRAVDVLEALSNDQAAAGALTPADTKQIGAAARVLTGGGRNGYAEGLVERIAKNASPAAASALVASAGMTGLIAGY